MAPRKCKVCEEVFMTMEKKLKAAYQQGVAYERGRVLWLMDDERKALRDALEQKILIEAHRHIIQTKIKMAVVIYQQLQHRIVSGHGAPVKPKSALPPAGEAMIDKLVEDIAKSGEREANEEEPTES